MIVNKFGSSLKQSGNPLDLIFGMTMIDPFSLLKSYFEDMRLINSVRIFREY